jgi:RNA polymerase sigma-70 factor (family 1)
MRSAAHVVLATSSRESIDAERDLVEGIRSGDERAFERVMRGYAEALYAFAVSYVGSADVARDVVQDMFVALWEGRARLRIPGALAPYLFQGVRYRCLNALRRGRLERRYEARVATGEVAVAVATEDPWADMERSELYATVVRAVMTLPAKQRTVVELRWGSGLPYAAIAERMQMSEKGVEFHMRRALAALRALLR